jgi:hypothetical protein
MTYSIGRETTVVLTVGPPRRPARPLNGSSPDTRLPDSSACSRRAYGVGHLSSGCHDRAEAWRWIE